MGATKQAKYYIHNGVDFDEYRFETDASVVNVQDTAKNYTSKNVEGILQEVGSQLTDVSKPNPNILPNSSGQFEMLNWTDSSGGKIIPITDTIGNGYYFKTSNFTTDSSSRLTLVNTLSVSQNTTFTLSADMLGSLTSGEIRIEVICRDSNNTYLDYFPMRYMHTETGWKRKVLTFTTPANTSKIQISLMVYINTVGTDARWRRIKLERGDRATPYSQEADIVATSSVLQATVLDAFYLDTNSTATGIKVANADSLSGFAFETNVTSAVKKLAEFTIPKCWHLPYNVGIRVKVNNNTASSYILTVKANDLTIGTLKGTDFDTTTWCFKNFLYDNDKSSIKITIETTTSNSGTIISIENCYLSPVGMAFMS